MVQLGNWGPEWGCDLFKVMAESEAEQGPGLALLTHDCVSQLCLIPLESQTGGWLDQNPEPGTDERRAEEEEWTWVEGMKLSLRRRVSTRAPFGLWREH